MSNINAAECNLIFELLEHTPGMKQPYVKVLTKSISMLKTTSNFVPTKLITSTTSADQLFVKLDLIGDDISTPKNFPLEYPTLRFQLREGNGVKGLGFDFNNGIYP